MGLLSKKRKKANPESEKDLNEDQQMISYYPDAIGHILEEFRWLNRLLSAHVIRLRRVNFYEQLKDFRGFFISDDEVDALLSAGVFESNGEVQDSQRKSLMSKLLDQAQSIREEINQRLQESIANNIFLPLVQLKKIFHLQEMEMQALVICLAPQIDARYEKLYAYLNNDITKKAPSIDLVLSLLFKSPEERIQFSHYFNPAAPLRYYKLIEYLENGSRLSSGQYFFRADTRIVQYVTGNQDIDSQIMHHMHFWPYLDWGNIEIPIKLQERLQNVLRRLLDDMSGNRSAIYLYGRPGVGKKTIVQAMCSEVGVSVIAVDLRNLLAAPGEFNKSIRLILRESLLQSCAVYFDHLETLEDGNRENFSLFASFGRLLREMGWLTFLGSSRPLPSEWIDDLPIYAVEIPAPDYSDQKKIWQLYLNNLMDESESAWIDSLVSQFDLTGGQIVRAVQMAGHHALARGSQKAHVKLTDLMAGCRLQSQPDLGRLAKKIQPVFTWKDIVLPQDALTQLGEICQRVRHRHHVLEDWGFNLKMSQGMGVNALFAGPSGTGKTMAAEIIANELGLDIYKIDLSGVVSKYIGETEKNLNRIFTAAEHANVILFFDEADALFGKRSEVRDSHDRFANIEISYLLQKMEQFEGIAILATNLRQNLDESFVRRLTFTVHLPFPDAASRLRIWQGIWPEETPIANNVDLEFLSQQFKLSGGNIKNAAIAAAFLAVENGDEVKMKHLQKAICREYQKMGKALSESDLAQNVELLKYG